MPGHTPPRASRSDSRLCSAHSPRSPRRDHPSVARSPSGRAFRGPGARDGFEAVTRAVTDGRYVVDRALLRADRGRLLEDFVFEVGLGGTTVTLLLRDGFVDDEFIDLARTEPRTAAQESRLAALKIRAGAAGDGHSRSRRLRRGLSARR